MRFDFATADRIIFGPGTLGELAPLLAGLGTRAFVVTGSNPKRAERLIAGLGEHKVKAFVFPVSGEPSIEIVEAGIREAVQNKCDCVVALGGGSAIDGGKAIAALATNPGNIFDYLEVIGKAQPIQRAPLPFIAIPTTAG